MRIFSLAFGETGMYNEGIKGFILQHYHGIPQYPS